MRMSKKGYRKGGLKRRRVREGRGPSMEVPMRDEDLPFPTTPDAPDITVPDRRRRRPTPRPVMKSGGLMDNAKMTKGKGKFPDLTGDGKVTKKDVLKGRGVPGMKNGGMMMKKKGYAKGGKVRGCGIATKGVRKAKMVTMKGS